MANKDLNCIPGSKAFRKIVNTLKNHTRSTATAIAIADTVSVTELEFISTGRKPLKIKKVALAAVDTAGGVAAFTPGVACIIHRIYLNVTTKSTSASTLSAGVATNATTSSANLIDTVDSGTAAGLFDNLDDHGTLGKSKQLCSATQSVTVSKASGATAGLVGFAYIEYNEI